MRAWELASTNRSTCRTDSSEPTEKTPLGSISMFAGVVRGPGVCRLVQQRQQGIYPGGFQGKFLVEKWGQREALSSGG